MNGALAGPQAADAGYLTCLACRQLSRPLAGAARHQCPRCGTAVRARKRRSIERTWAFLIAAYALYIPANVMPFMDSRSLFLSQRDTILSGVMYLWETGSYGTAALIFFASVVEPLLKLAGLTVLVLAVKRGFPHLTPLRATRMYRLIHVVGRWSMLDIFVVAILVALVQSPTLAQITVGPGALAFGLVVILTMFAASSFDTRLLWDARTRNG